MLSTKATQQELGPLYQIVSEAASRLKGWHRNQGGHFPSVLSVAYFGDQPTQPLDIIVGTYSTPRRDELVQKLREYISTGQLMHPDAILVKPDRYAVYRLTKGGNEVSVIVTETEDANNKRYGLSNVLSPEEELGILLNQEAEDGIIKSLAILTLNSGASSRHITSAEAIMLISMLNRAKDDEAQWQGLD